MTLEVGNAAYMILAKVIVFYCLIMAVRLNATTCAS